VNLFPTLCGGGQWLGLTRVSKRLNNYATDEDGLRAWWELTSYLWVTSDWSISQRRRRFTTVQCRLPLLLPGTKPHTHIPYDTIMSPAQGCAVSENTVRCGPPC